MKCRLKKPTILMLIQRDIENAIKEKETQWNLANRYPRPDDTSIDLIWTSGRQKVNVSIYYLASQDDAASKLRLLRDTIPIGSGNAVENLGYRAPVKDTQGAQLGR
jgi:hypothetical protein